MFTIYTYLLYKSLLVQGSILVYVQFFGHGWADTTDPGSHQQVMMIATILNNRDQYGDSDCEDTKTWKAHVPEWLHEYGNVFSKHKSERMPLRKPYDHAIDFMEGAKLPKPAKVYSLSLAERNSLDTWIDEELRKGYIHSSTSPIAALFFFVKKHDGSLRPIVMPYKTLGKLSDILHLNNRNNQLERQAWPPQKRSSRRLVVDLSI